MPEVTGAAGSVSGAERAWGTVREDYSADGDAWSFFRTRTPGPGCTGGTKTALPGSATKRMFGLTGPQGNPGDDVKEYWWSRGWLWSTGCWPSGSRNPRK